MGVCKWVNTSDDCVMRRIWQFGHHNRQHFPHRCATASVIAAIVIAAATTVVTFSATTKSHCIENINSVLSVGKINISLNHLRRQLVVVSRHIEHKHNWIYYQILNRKYLTKYKNKKKVWHYYQESFDESFLNPGGFRKFCGRSKKEDFVNFCNFSTQTLKIRPNSLWNKYYWSWIHSTSDLISNW